jgi:hypothetical protein
VKKLVSLLILSLVVAELALSTLGAAEAAPRKKIVLPPKACQHIPKDVVERIPPICGAVK